MKKIKTTILTLMMLVCMMWIPANKAEAATDITQAERIPMDEQWNTFYKDENARCYHRFVVPSDGLVSWKFISSMTLEKSYDGVYFGIYDENMSRIWYQNFTYSTPINPTMGSDSMVLSAGNYYLVLTDEYTNLTNTGKYQVSFKFESFAANDGNALSYESPQSISVNQKITGALTWSDREDWFKIVIPQTGNYADSMSANTSLNVYLYNSNLSTTLGSYTVNGDWSKSAVAANTYTLQAGTYYVKVQGRYNYGGKYNYTLSPAECTHSYTSTTTRPTYFAKGYTTHTCTECGKTYKDTYTSKLTLAKESISSLKAGKKKMVARWKNVSGASGYQVRYSTDKKFKKSVKTTTLKGRTKTAKTITGLKSKKTYYVQVRAYRSSGAKKAYGKWSSTKKVKIK